MDLRAKVYQELAPEARSTGISLTNWLIIGLVLLSFLFLALETEPALNGDPAWRRVFDIFNVGVVSIFALEFITRLWAMGEDPKFAGAGGRLKYMMQFHSITDLLAFLPELIVMITGAGIPLIALRVLRLFRLIKIARFVPAFDVFAAALNRAGSQLLTALGLALMLVYLAAVLLYFIEGVGEGNEKFASIPRAIWWSVATLTTVGYGDVYPETVLGRIAAGLIAMAGVGVVALPAGVFASAFSDELRERQQRKAEGLAPPHKTQ
jgi:voltage-gated potassium channel